MVECTVPQLTFDESAKLEILDFLNKTKDDEGFIVEKEKQTQKVLTVDGEEITVDEFGGAKAGSEVFIKRDLISLMKLSRS